MYEVNINFEEASRAWKENKVSTGNGTYKYICGATRKDGGKCQNRRQNGKMYCHIHFLNHKSQ